MLLPTDGDTPPVSFVFGYGSLIWRPGFVHGGAEPALLRGAHRCLCVFSHRYRGTSERPGLVFGLAHGGSCRGMAFRIPSSDWEEVRAYLWDREMVTGVYRPSVRLVELSGGRSVEALVFLADPAHAQYAGQLDLDAQVRFIRQGHGQMGTNADYVLNTARHLEDLGIPDHKLQRVCRALGG
ncbi:MAG: gamma-glutamylcyclotransferase [Alphaproteobacteria bacterium]|nr:gamma-glutamylcyclotransferase [Alphaproteobacteria bacterium]